MVAKLRLSSCNQNEWHFIRTQNSVAITILLVQLNSPIERKRQRRERERKITWRVVCNSFEEGASLKELRAVYPISTSCNDRCHLQQRNKEGILQKDGIESEAQL